MSYVEGHGNVPPHYRLDQFDPDERGKGPLATLLTHLADEVEVRLVFGMELADAAPKQGQYGSGKRVPRPEEEEEEEKPIAYASRKIDRQVSIDILRRSRRSFTLTDMVARWLQWPSNFIETLLWVDVYA
jgi:hypothetical protein